MTDQEAILTAQLDAAREPRTEPAPPPESEHESLMRAVHHMTDAVLRVDATLCRLERALGKLAEAVEGCPIRSPLVAVGGE
jgi:hypothetical protein